MRLREDGAMLSVAEHVLAPIWSCHGLRECQGPGVDMQVSSGLTACLGWPLTTVADKSRVLAPDQ